MPKSPVFYRYRPALLLLGVALALSNCSKSESDASSGLFVNFGPGEGFTYRTGNNLPAGFQDPTDWQLDSQWNTREQGLFTALGVDFNAAPRLVPNATPSTYFIAYPNPAVSSFIFSYSTPAPVFCKAVVANQFYQPLAEFTSSQASSSVRFSVNVAGQGFKPGSLYRVYYVLYNGTTLYGKGHGDIKIAE